jgi:hypothetical protein
MNWRMYRAWRCPFEQIRCFSLSFGGVFSRVVLQAFHICLVTESDDCFLRAGCHLGKMHPSSSRYCYCDCCFCVGQGRLPGLIPASKSETEKSPPKSLLIYPSDICFVQFRRQKLGYLPPGIVGAVCDFLFPITTRVEKQSGRFVLVFSFRDDCFYMSLVGFLSFGLHHCVL